MPRKPLPVIHRRIQAYGHAAVVACDARCDKAWGINHRPRLLLSDDEDDYVWLADGELGDAPLDPGTYEGGHHKPRKESERLNKWCFRECERSASATTPDDVSLHDFTQRLYNMPHLHGETRA